MNAFDRYPPAARAGVDRRHLPSYRRAQPITATIADDERSRARGLRVFFALLGLCACLYLGVWMIGRSIWHHARFSSSPAASAVPMPRAAHAIARAAVVEAGRRSPAPR